MDRSQYTDDTMPEHPGATLINHVVLAGMNVGSVAGCLVFAPLQYLRGGRKEALFKTVNKVHHRMATLMIQMLCIGALYGTK